MTLSADRLVRVMVVVCDIFFFFKQKTAYEMRISDWSSDVCSSNLVVLQRLIVERLERRGIIEIVAERVRGAVGVEDLGRQHLGPPILVGAAEQRADSAGLVNGAAASGVDGGRVVHAVSPLMVWKQRDRSRSEEHTSELQSLMRTS